MRACENVGLNMIADLCGSVSGERKESCLVQTE